MSILYLNLHHQIDIANKVIKVMTIIEEVTKSISADAATVSVIIPFVCIVSKSLSQSDDDTGVHTMKNEMKSSLMRRFADVEENQYLTVATLLDPRFKDKFFIHPSIKIQVSLLIQKQISRILVFKLRRKSQNLLQNVCAQLCGRYIPRL